MNKYKTISKITDSPYVAMGNIRLRQPIPNQGISQIDPFVLLHHYGPFAISPFNNAFDLGPHPHRGFEPITILFQGEQRHRDSLGNDNIVEAGGVQWTTAGRGIIHAEGPTKSFVEKGGTLEGIQLWVNLPSEKKMMPANYQHVRQEDMPKLISEDRNIELRVVAGNHQDLTGKINTQTPMNVFVIESSGKGKMKIDIPTDHNALIYLLDGHVIMNGDNPLKKNENQMISFNQDGDAIFLESIEPSKLLVLSGLPLNEKVVQYGPYVMNSETEIMEAMRDYKIGKMGFLGNV